MRSLAAVAVVLGFAVSAHAEPLDIRVSGHLALHPLKPGVTATPVLVNSHTQYLNRCASGCQVHEGNTDSTTDTSDIAGGTVSLTANNGGETKRGQINDSVNQVLAPFNVTVTDCYLCSSPLFVVMVAVTAGQLNAQLGVHCIL